MAEKINVYVKGETIEATKNENGNYYVSLPTPPNSSLTRNLSSEEDGWRFTEHDSEHPDSYFWMKMYKDGTVEYANDMMKSSKIVVRNYHPDFSDLGTLSNLGKEIYGIIQQLDGYEKLGVAPNDVLDIRRKIMGLSLKMLGYGDINSIFYAEPNPDDSILDLNHTVKYLERYPALAQYVTRMKYSGLDTVMVNIPQDGSKEEFQQMYQAAKEDYDAEFAYVSERLYEIGRRRDPFILPDFGKGLKQFLERKNAGKRGQPNAWNDYVDTTKKLSKLILGFNSDLLPAHEKMRVVQSTSLNQVELLHQISLITEPAEMDEVLASESYYFINEADRLSQKVQEDLGDDRTSSSTPGNIMKELAEVSKLEAEDREKAIKDRHYYRNIYPYDRARKVDYGTKANRKKEDDERGYFD